MLDEKLYGFVFTLLQKAGFHGDFSLHPLTKGTNNKVFKVDVSGSQVLCKAYFHDTEDPRDRLHQEFSFLSFARKHGMHCIPSPLARDDENHLGLYEFINGKSINDAAQITSSLIEQALDFYHALNACRNASDALRLPAASEACFTLSAHLQCVEKRIARLQKILLTSDINEKACAFVQNDLISAWESIRNSVLSEVHKLQLPLDEALPLEDRILSPSDFGFHNARLTKDGNLVFLDFEYAGWDDPVKMVCDFFCHPQTPVSMKYYMPFLSAAVSDLPQKERHLLRAPLLLPVHKMKWCCILLNEFLPVDGRRRKFSRDFSAQEKWEEHKEMQLEKARKAFHELLERDLMRSHLVTL